MNVGNYTTQAGAGSGAPQTGLEGLSGAFDWGGGVSKGINAATPASVMNVGTYTGRGRFRGISHRICGGGRGFRGVAVAAMQLLLS
jgi:hypothetical protein